MITCAFQCIVRIIIVVGAKSLVIMVEICGRFEGMAVVQIGVCMGGRSRRTLAELVHVLSLTRQLHSDRDVLAAITPAISPRHLSDGRGWHQLLLQKGTCLFGILAWWDFCLNRC